MGTAVENRGRQAGPSRAGRRHEECPVRVAKRPTAKNGILLVAGDQTPLGNCRSALREPTGAPRASRNLWTDLALGIKTGKSEESGGRNMTKRSAQPATDGWRHPGIAELLTPRIFSTATASLLLLLLLPLLA